MLAFLTVFLLLAAFVLLLLVSLSVPIIKSIFLFKLTIAASSSLLKSSVDSTITFGIWGYCIDSLNANVGSFQENQGAQCSPRRLGYTFDATLLQLLHLNSNTANIISKAITAALVIHPIACGLAFLALLFSLAIPFRGIVSRGFSAFTMIISVVAAILSTVVFVLDIVLVELTRHRILDATDGDVALSWGNAVWMTLGAAVALWLATLGACCGIFACGGHRRRDRVKY